MDTATYFNVTDIGIIEKCSFRQLAFDFNI